MDKSPQPAVNSRQEAPLALFGRFGRNGGYDRYTGNGLGHRRDAHILEADKKTDRGVPTMRFIAGALNDAMLWAVPFE